jgi:glycogen debranching enzyme
VTFAGFVDRGMLPNLFPGAGGKPDYNTVDVALWFFKAWRAYVGASGDRESLAEVFPILAEMVDCHLQGTRYGIRVDPDDTLYRMHGSAVLALQRLAAMRDHLFDAGLGTIGEIFEAEPPHE